MPGGETDPRLKGRPRRRLLAQVRREEPDCHLCGGWINQTLDAQHHSMGSTIDELIPRSRGGDPHDRTNLRHAHRLCNSTRGNQPITPAVLARIHAVLTGRAPHPHEVSDAW